MKHMVRGFVCLATVAGLSFGASAYVALDYEQDGLVCQFDGIENVGHGQAHSSDTDRWVDLTGNGYDWTLNNRYNERDRKARDRMDELIAGPRNAAIKVMSTLV